MHRKFGALDMADLEFPKSEQRAIRLKFDWQETFHEQITLFSAPFGYQSYDFETMY